MIPVQKLADVMCSILEDIKPGDEITTYAFLYEKKRKNERPICEGSLRISSLRLLMVNARDLMELRYRGQSFPRLRTACAIFWLALVMVWTLWRREGKWRRVE